MNQGTNIAIIRTMLLLHIKTAVKKQVWQLNEQNLLALMFTWVIILGGAEVKRSLGALQSHLAPVCDSLQLHSVTVVLLQSLQIHPTLSLQQQKTLAC